MCKISLSYLLKQKHYAQKGRQPYPNPNPNTNVFVISVIQYVPQATTAFFGQNRVKPTHIYYLDSNGPTYNIHNMRPQLFSVNIESSILTYTTCTQMVQRTTSTTSDHNLFRSTSCQAYSHIIHTPK